MDVPTGFDAVLHPPARLQIAAVLAQVQNAEFALLRKITGASDSVMSKHLAAMVDAGYVSLSKAAANGRQRTWASLTRSGRAAFRTHVAALDTLAAGIENWSGREDSNLRPLPPEDSALPG
jgi:DNA-binding MarR family transcriptional regulator